jgi:hypothetical protein
MDVKMKMPELSTTEGSDITILKWLVEIAAGLSERDPGLIIERIASPDVPVPFTPVLENAYRPAVPQIVAAGRRFATAEA